MLRTFPFGALTHCKSWCFWGVIVWFIDCTAMSSWYCVNCFFQQINLFRFCCCCSFFLFVVLHIGTLHGTSIFACKFPGTVIADVCTFVCKCFIFKEPTIFQELVFNANFFRFGLTKTLVNLLTKYKYHETTERCFNLYLQRCFVTTKTHILHILRIICIFIVIFCIQWAFNWRCLKT